jgi:hypothetical protein
MTNGEQSEALSPDSAFRIPHSEFPPWGFRDLALLLLCAIGSLVLAQAGGLTVLAVVRGWHNLPAPAALMRDVRFLLPVQFAAYLMFVLSIYLLIAVWRRWPFWEAVRWRWVGGRWPGFVFLGTALALGAQLLPLLFPRHRRMPIEDLFTGPLAGYLLAFFGIVIAPFVEELFFRGVVYPVFERRWGLEVAVLATAACFASIHIPQLGKSWPEVLAIFLVGAAFSYARGRTGSLLPPYLMHVGYNTTLFAAIFVASQGFTKFP